MHIAQQLSPMPKSKWEFWFKHTNKQQHQHWGNKPIVTTRRRPMKIAEAGSSGSGNGGSGGGGGQ